MASSARHDNRSFQGREVGIGIYMHVPPISLQSRGNATSQANTMRGWRPHFLPPADLMLRCSLYLTDMANDYKTLTHPCPKTKQNKLEETLQSRSQDVCRTVSSPSFPQGHASNQPRNHSLPPRNPFLPELLLIPPLPLQRPRQHGGNLIDQKRPRRHARPAADHPKPCPLDPLAKVVRVEHVAEQPVLGHHVHLVDALDGLALLVCLALLLARRRATYLAQVVVVECVA